MADSHTTRLDTLLLLALPGSGKSEIRRYLESVDDEVAARDFGLGPTVQLDDYPYVQLMQSIDREVRAAGGPPVFFSPIDGILLEPRDWATLARLLEEDYGHLGGPIPAPAAPVAHMLDRFDRARDAVGAEPVTRQIGASIAAGLGATLEDEVGAFLQGLRTELVSHRPGSTVVIEFARGGPEGAAMPLSPPHGYAYTLPHLGDAMLEAASILHVSVTPGESKKRNLERSGSGPAREESVLHHRVPDPVMRNDYGSDDLAYLIREGDGVVEVETEAGSHQIPAATFDNEPDYTSFLRSEPAAWASRTSQASTSS